MELSNETVRKIRGLIVFTALVTACLWKYDVVVRALAFVFHIILPFVLGGAIAFVLNVPMNFVPFFTILSISITVSTDVPGFTAIPGTIPALIILCKVVDGWYSASGWIYTVSPGRRWFRNK